MSSTPFKNKDVLEFIMKHGSQKGLIISSLHEKHEQYKDLHTKCNSISKYFDQVNNSNDP